MFNLQEFLSSGHALGRQVGGGTNEKIGMLLENFGTNSKLKITASPRGRVITMSARGAEYNGNHL